MEINWTDLIIGLCSIILTIFVAPYLKAKYTQIKDESVDFWLRTLMSAAETYFGSGAGQQKKEWVLTELQNYFTGLDMDKIQDNLEAMFRELVIEGIINNDEIEIRGKE